MAKHVRDLGLERQWRRRLREWQRSGMTGRDFCRQHSLSEPSFYGWRREIARRDREQATTPTPGFVPVTLVESPRTDDGAIDIRLRGGQRLRVRVGCDRRLLADVVAVLEGRPC